MGAIASGRNHSSLALCFKSLNHSFVCIISFVRNYRVGKQLRQQLVGSIQVAGLSGGEMKAQGITQRIDGRMNLGTQSPFAASNCFLVWLPPFAPALCWWARTIVASIMAYSLSASSAKC